MNRILKSYLKRLTNLSKRNKSLLLTRLPAEQFVDLHETDFLDGNSSFDTIENIVQKRSRIVLCDVADPRYDKVNELSRKLRKISRTEKFIEEERGTRDLYVGFPFVRGKFADGSVVHAPLLFFPVTLQMHREQWCLVTRDDAGTSLNRSFALAYSRFNETPVPDTLLETAFEEFPHNITLFRTELYKWLKETPFKLNYNQQLFEDKLIPFDQAKSTDLELVEKTGELKLYPEAVLGIFPQAGSYLEPDYHFMLQNPDAGMLPFDLAPESTDREEQGIPEPAKPIKEEQILTPFAIDASQEAVVHAVKNGKSVVVQGPPGTGKSQLICNLIADFTASGKRVLLVCQKRAALDVVHQRLQNAGLVRFAALIHDFRNDRPALYRQLAEQIENLDEFRRQNYSLDAVFLEREFTRESRQIDRLAEELSRFREALFDESEAGVSVKHLYLTTDPGMPLADLSDFYRITQIGADRDYVHTLHTYVSYSLQIHHNHPWRKRVDFSGFALPEKRAMDKILEEWQEFVVTQSDLFFSVTGSQFSAPILKYLPELKASLERLAELVSDAEVFAFFRRYSGSATSPNSRRDVINSAVKNLAEWDRIEQSVSQNEIPAYSERIKTALQSKQSWIGGIGWNLFSKEKESVTALASRNRLGTTPDDLTTLLELLRRRSRLEAWLETPELQITDSLPSVQRNNLLASVSQLFSKIDLADQATVLTSSIPVWNSVLPEAFQRQVTFEEWGNCVQQLLIWISDWEDLFAQLEPYFHPAQVNRLIREPEFATPLRGNLQTDFDAMVEMDQIWTDLSLNQREVTRIVIDKGEEQAYTEAEQWVKLYQNSLGIAWIEHIESRYPELRAVSTRKMSDWEQLLQDSIQRKQELSRDIALIKLRDQTYSKVESNRLGNRVTYRDLLHQTTKKKKIWPIRRLLENHSEEIFDLIPCWMASPESVSAIFPMRQHLFDLVIFDEASQCFAEYGLPAAFRARQVVVTGDSKQLQPGDLYRIRFEETEDEETPAALEVPSLLDLATHSLELHQLRGHYRSKSLELIDFSNRHFYKNSLRLLPDFTHLTNPDPGITYIKVDGKWEKNTNRTEADRVIELLRQLKPGGLSIGVVTFNFQQQQLIQELLEQENLGIPDLFVKNIENVQGDERDVIIFSLAYAPDARGKVAMNFGTLNMQGGENRLNVAVTRAREKVYVITSLSPSQLNTDTTANEGPRLLKDYLQFALDVSEGKFRPEPTEPKQTSSSLMLRDILLRHDETLKRELPFADLTVFKDGRYERLVLTDDDLYHQSAEIKEPHGYLPVALRNKNWKFQRIFSRQYWQIRG